MIHHAALSLGELAGAAAPTPGVPADAAADRDQGAPRREAAGGAGALGELLAEAGALDRRLRRLRSAVDGEAVPSGARGAVLMELARLGPRSVPQLARARSVSRQHVQALVNGLAEAGYVERVENPAHRRSPLIRMAPRGARAVQAMERAAGAGLAAVEGAPSEGELRRAAGVLRALGKALDRRSASAGRRRTRVRR